MGRTTHRDNPSGTVQLPGFLYRVFSAVVNPVAGANDLAGELLQLAEARLVVLERVNAGAQAIVAPSHLHPLLEHPALIELLRQARKLESPRFYSTDEAVPGLADIRSPEKQTNCLAVPLIDNGTRIGTVAVFGLLHGALDKTTGTMEMLAPLLAMALRNTSMQSHSDKPESDLQAARLEQIAHHDPLTGLPNRVLLGDRLQQAVARNLRDATIIAVCYIDLDGFKEINDRFGHHAGDQLLIDVANRLTACVRGGDTVARLGGDEFVVLLSGLSGEEECRVALERLLQTVADPYVVSGNEQSGISASIGVTLFPNDQSDPDMLVRHADHAMYVAKQAGKNRYQLFDADLEMRIEARHSTLRQLTDASKSDQFRLYYQPKVNCRQGRVVGVEALIRWQHPTLGLLSPAEFLPLIEDTDLAFSIGEWVIREAISQMSRWKNEGVDLHISVNAFVRHLLQPGFAAMLAAALKQHPGVKAGDLQIEIVETASLKDLDAIRDVIEDCKKLGVAFSLDDFGAGYSTLAYLRHLPATEIKIDHSFVRHMLERGEDLAIVEAVIGMGRAFGRSLVAEGAETAAHIVRLLALGCDVMQGYALARPMEASEIPRWLREFRPDPAWHGPAGNSDKAPRNRG